jgi:hypothetical protein
VSVTIQDFCNMLGGGLVSFSTLTQKCITDVTDLPSGIVIATYTYNAEDVVASAENAVAVAATGAVNGAHTFHIIAWKGNSRALNVMCGKVGELSLWVMLYFSCFGTAGNGPINNFNIYD